MSVKPINELDTDMGPFEVRLQQSGGGVQVRDARSSLDVSGLKIDFETYIWKILPSRSGAWRSVQHRGKTCCSCKVAPSLTSTPLLSRKCLYSKSPSSLDSYPIRSFLKCKILLQGGDGSPVWAACNNLAFVTKLLWKAKTMMWQSICENKMCKKRRRKKNASDLLIAL